MVSQRVRHDWVTELNWNITSSLTKGQINVHFHQYQVRVLVSSHWPEGSVWSNLRKISAIIIMKKMLWCWFQVHFPNCGWVLLVLSEAMLATSVKYGEAWVAFFPFMVDFIIWMSENNLIFREFHCGPVIRAQRFHGPGHRFDPCSEN